MENRFDFGQTLDDVIEVLKNELERVGSDNDARLPYRYISETRPRNSRITFPSEMCTAAQAATQRHIGPTSRPYRHQTQAWNSLFAGKSVVITTPTASGKTLCFNPVVLDNAIRHGGSTLYVYPLVDLATSQHKDLEKLIGNLQAVGQYETAMPRVTSFHSGEDPNTWRERIRRDPLEFVMTTPETLHGSLLPNSYPNWDKFFKRLRFVVVDEAHLYSGIFGTNMAFILRRLVHRCWRSGGVTPQFVVCSATIKDPPEFAKKLLPLRPDIDWIADPTGGSPARHEMAFLANTQTLIDLFIRLLELRIVDRKGKERGVRTILFEYSRKGVQRLTNSIGKSLDKAGKSHLKREFEYYRHGRAGAPAIFERLMKGELSSIVTTNKLMAGIDIGELDVSIVHGFQRRFLDMRQMLGRAARQNPGAWIFVGSPRSLEDQFVVDTFPAAFDCEDPEASVIDLRNRHLLHAHLRCLDGSSSQSHHQEGPANVSHVEQLFGSVRVPDALKGRVPWNANPVDKIQIRGAHVGDTYELELDGAIEKVAEGDPASVTEFFAYRDYHPGAIFEEDGSIYRVEQIRSDPARIEARQIDDQGKRTRCREKTTARCIKATESVSRLGLDVMRGEFEITHDFATYSLLALKERWACPRRLCKFDSSTEGKCPTHGRLLRYVRDWEPEGEYGVEPPLSIELVTTGVEFGLAQPFAEYTKRLAADREHDHAEFVTDGSEDRLLLALVRLFVNAYEDAFLAEGRILGGIDYPGENRILFYDNFPGGIGIAEALFSDEEGKIFTAALRRIRGCRCTQKHGCMKCVLPPFAQGGQVSEKAAVVGFLSWFVEERAALVGGGDYGTRRREKTSLAKIAEPGGSTLGDSES